MYLQESGLWDLDQQSRTTFLHVFIPLLPQHTQGKSQHFFHELFVVAMEDSVA